MKDLRTERVFSKRGDLGLRRQFVAFIQRLISMALKWLTQNKVKRTSFSFRRMSRSVINSINMSLCQFQQQAFEECDTPCKMYSRNVTPHAKCIRGIFLELNSVNRIVEKYIYYLSLLQEKIYLQNVSLWPKIKVKTEKRTSFCNYRIL